MNEPGKNVTIQLYELCSQTFSAQNRHPDSTCYLADEKQGKASEWRSWTSLMLSSSDGQRQDGCLLNIQDKQELTGLKEYFPGNLVESTWEDESTINNYVASGLVSLFKRNISSNL